MITFKTDSSKMNKIIEFFKPDENIQVYDDLGVHPRENKPVYKCWAEVIPQTGSRMRGAVDGYYLERTTHKFVIRWTPVELTADMVIKLNGKEYQILYILNPYEKDEELEIFAEFRMQGENFYV